MIIMLLSLCFSNEQLAVHNRNQKDKFQNISHWRKDSLVKWTDWTMLLNSTIM